MDVHVMIEPHNGASYDDQLALARAAQEFGFAGLFRADHYLAGNPAEVGAELTDTWTTLAGLARETAAITLGSLVSSATFRLPGALAVIVAQVDAMSGGRVELGLGAGWWAAEHHAMGIAFPSTAERFDRLEEQLAILNGLWTTPPGERFSFPGAHYQLERAAGLVTVRPGGPPIIIGGSGRRRTPAIAARYAAEFNSGWEPPSATAKEFTRAAGACAVAGRDAATLRMSSVQSLCVAATDGDLRRRAETLGADPADLRARSEGITGSPAEAVDRIGQYQAAGAARIYLQLLDLHDLGQLELVAAEVLPQLRSAKA